MSEAIRIGGGGKSSGAYVWKKYPLVDTTVSNPTITLNGIATNPTLSSQDINLDLADESTFGGFLSTSNPTGYYFKYENAKLYYVDPDGQYEATYDQTTHKLSIPTCPSTGSHNNAAFKSTGNKVVKILGEPEFVVSDDSNAYPDGAVHTDGYYYERFVGELTPEMFGCTKVAIDTVTFASDQHFLSNGAKYYLPHSLGEIPKHAILWAQTDITTYVYPGYLQGFDIRKNVGLNAYDCVNWLIQSNNSFTGQLRTPSLTADGVYINGGTFKAGVEYKLITMA